MYYEQAELKKVTITTYLSIEQEKY